ncbi:hypothetical protein T12_5965 [Trichinella patagoniensis]|uniref:Uncharacterized protein n=1 Tax=Trichinella patagoniensis TaxID=990121 RepID=A0A0V0XBU1_9BILA|nr:hypothetical protein T12_5965 [Trichinella patagoniensis]
MAVCIDDASISARFKEIAQNNSFDIVKILAH